MRNNVLIKTELYAYEENRLKYVFSKTIERFKNLRVVVEV